MTSKQKFRVEEWVHYSRLGRRRKKLLKYRKARGRDSKVRLHMKGHLKNVEIGFKSEKSKRGLIEGKMPVVVYNLKDLNRLKEKEIGIIGKIGNKKRIEIADYCIKNKIKVLNLNPEKFLAGIEEQKNKKKEEKAKLQEKTKEKEKKAKKEDKKEKIEEKKTEVDNKNEPVTENAEEKK
ncbi:MAG: eL32 family ribosomal protein [Nanoarchaeota archaeon]|nr:eL32 family ribosomal protein [Nanoarchaeota archaeon]